MAKTGISRLAVWAALASGSIAAGIVMASRLTQSPAGSAAPSSTAAFASAESARMSQAQPAELTNNLNGTTAEANILLLPKASADFVGYWGGYIHSSVERFDPSFIGIGPERVSVIFGLESDTVFMDSELYSSLRQRIVHGPTASIRGARLMLVEYESVDNDFDYTFRHRFRLNDATSVSYRATVDVYERGSHRLIGVVEEKATLKRLRTAREQLAFARPGHNLLPRAEVSAHGNSRPR
jgi:hypothetical protein